MLKLKGYEVDKFKNVMNSVAQGYYEMSVDDIVNLNEVCDILNAMNKREFYMVFPVDKKDGKNCLRFHRDILKSLCAAFLTGEGTTIYYSFVSKMFLSCYVGADGDCVNCKAIFNTMKYLEETKNIKNEYVKEFDKIVATILNYPWCLVVFED